MPHFNETNGVQVVKGHAGKYLSRTTEIGLNIASFAGGQPKPGVVSSAEALFAAGLSDVIEERGFQTVQRNVVAPQIEAVDTDIRGMKNPRAVSEFSRALSDQTYELAKDGRFVLTIGGDHSIAMGSVSGMQRAIRERFPTGTKHAKLNGNGYSNGDHRNKAAKAPQDIGIIWVDAHPDINTPGMSPSGNVHGMPNAFLSGIAQAEKARETGTEAEEDGVFGWLSQSHRINLQKLVYIGIRDADEGERKIIKDHGILTFTMDDVVELGMPKILSLALNHIGPETPVHLSFDVDAIDPVFVPGTGTPVPAGLGLREAFYLCRTLHATGNLVSMDVVEVNTDIDGLENKEKEKTVKAAVGLINAGLGGKLL
ncbi:Arginase, catabolizes arginine to ornithine and urea [Ascosphaera atra]|nr:Arginase, catabolizes arginine to ornithine and urea [Ascosphaera atra]